MAGLFDRPPPQGLFGGLGNLAQFMFNPAGFGMALARGPTIQGMREPFERGGEAVFGGNPQAVGINPQTGSIDPSVMVPWATEMAGNAATGGFAIPKQSGTLGIFGGRLAKTADQAALAKAEQMAAEGIPRGTIWQQTGWFQGADGKWRFEISDDLAQLNPNKYGAGRDAAIPPEPVEALSAGQLWHPGLYPAYPQASATKMSIERAHGKPGGSFTPDPDDPRIKVRAAIPEQAKSTALHELQHVVQEAEGFARGGNTLSLWNHSDPKVRKAVQDEFKRLTTPDDYETFARKMREVSPGVSEDIIKEQHKVAVKSAKKAQKDPYDTISRAAQETAAQNVYRRLAGEVEARNVSARRDLTPAQRRSLAPWLTEDVPAADQIIRIMP